MSYDTSFVILNAIGVAVVLLGIAVIQRNVYKISHRLFLGFAVSTSLWIGTNAWFQLADDSVAYAIALLSYVAAALIALFMLQFCRAFVDQTIQKKLIVVDVVLSISFGIPGFLATNVTTHVIRTTPFILIYALYILIHFGIATRLLFIYRNKNQGTIRSRANIILLGFFTSIAVGTFFNLFLPLAGVYDSVTLGPMAGLIMVSAMAVAILRHRLFDIRLVVARAVAYILILVTLAFAYAFVVFGITTAFLNSPSTVGLHATVSTILAVFLAFTFQPLKRFFDRLTTRLFYRDAYDTKQVLDAFSSVLVKESVINQLTHKALEILQQTLKPRFIYIYLVGDEEYKRGPFAVGVVDERFDVTPMIDQLVTRALPLVVQDDIETQNKALYKAMQKLDIVVSAQLKTSKELIGYIFFGYKVNGSIYSNQDINLIRITADELAVALQNALRFDEISRFNVTLQEEVKVATEKLRERNRKLKELDDAKNEFIAMASHQLRTPLTSMRGYISMALEDSEGELNYQQRRILGEANDSSRRLAYMIDDLLNVSRLQAGSFSIDQQPIHLERVIKEELSYLHSATKLRDIKIDYSMPSDFPVLNLDENKIRQVVMNFVDNAIYYSNKGDTIEVNLIKTARDVQLTVRDHGIGVPKADQPNLFTKFYRASNAKLKRPDGTGIGLFVAKKVIIEHGGRVIFKTEEGKGSTFGFSMPLSAVGINAQTAILAPQTQAKQLPGHLHQFLPPAE